MKGLPIGKIECLGVQKYNPLADTLPKYYQHTPRLCDAILNTSNKCIERQQVIVTKKDNGVSIFTNVVTIISAIVVSVPTVIILYVIGYLIFH